MQVKGAKLTCKLNHSTMQKGCLALRLPRQQEIKKKKKLQLNGGILMGMNIQNYKGLQSEF
jgi:hypothetical protein